jgi:hypothetical protein
MVILGIADTAATASTARSTVTLEILENITNDSKSRIEKPKS